MSGVIEPKPLGGWPQMILFDLDGTLIDSAPDIRTAANKLLAEYGHAPLDLKEVRGMIGNGIKKLVERAFTSRCVSLSAEELDKINARMMTIYGKHLTAETAMMPAAAETLADYHHAGVKTAVVTNKPEAFSRTILDELDLSAHVDYVIGGDTCPVRKPDPGMLYHAANLAGVRVARCLMVGDSPADIDAAKAAQMASVAVRGGYTRVPADELGADVVIETLHDLPAAIETLKQPV